MVPLNYEKWIKREQRIRIKILQSSPAINKDQIFRSCVGCEEICLCHEEVCPNCNSSDVVENNLDCEINSGFIKDRIRCRYRFNHLSDGSTKEN